MRLLSVARLQMLARECGLNSAGLSKQKLIESLETRYASAVAFQHFLGIDVGLKNMAVCRAHVEKQPASNKEHASVKVRVDELMSYQVVARDSYDIKEYAIECRELVERLCERKPDLVAIEKQILVCGRSALHANSKLLTWEALLVAGFLQKCPVESVSSVRLASLFNLKDNKATTEKRKRKKQLAVELIESLLANRREIASVELNLEMSPSALKEWSNSTKKDDFADSILTACASIIYNQNTLLSKHF